jgi:hypothetical protein
MILVLSGCAASNLGIRSEKDSFTGGAKSVTPLMEIQKDNTDESKAGDLHLLAIRNFESGKPPVYAIRVVHMFEFGNFYDFQKQDSLQFDVDGERLKFSTEETSIDNRALLPGILNATKIEHVTYKNIPEDSFKKIAFGKVVKIRVVGTLSNHDGFLAGKLKGFFQELTDPESLERNQTKEK